MAGARTVEEILTRRGAEHFSITVFGVEPYRNYNRILLSNVLNRSRDASEIFLNGLNWYEENGITLRAGVRVDVIARPRKAIHCDDGNWYPYDKLLIATGSRLDQEIEAAVAAYRDPWMEGRQPYEPTQFAEAAPAKNQAEEFAS